MVSEISQKEMEKINKSASNFKIKHYTVYCNVQNESDRPNMHLAFYFISFLY